MIKCSSFLQYSPESNFRCVFPGFEEFATLVKRKQDKFHRLDIDQGNLIEGCILKLERDSCYIKVFGQKIGFQHSMFQSLVSYFYEYNCACCRGKADQGHGWTCFEQPQSPSSQTCYEKSKFQQTHLLWISIKNRSCRFFIIPRDRQVSMMAHKLVTVELSSWIAFNITLSSMICLTF